MERPQSKLLAVMSFHPRSRLKCFYRCHSSYKSSFIEKIGVGAGFTDHLQPKTNNIINPPLQERNCHPIARTRYDYLIEFNPVLTTAGKSTVRPVFLQQLQLDNWVRESALLNTSVPLLRARPSYRAGNRPRRSKAVRVRRELGKR